MNGRMPLSVLKGMFGLSGVVVSESLIEAIPGLSEFGFSVGDHLANMLANDDVFRMIIFSAIIVFFCQNSNHTRSAL